MNNKRNADGNEEYFVDLGLPSGLKWAKTNLGAETETDYGDYFMWGSTKPNTADECKWTNAPFNGGSRSYNKEYFTAHKSVWLNNKNNLKTEYDAAYKATDGMARMPTNDDFQELIDNTINEWVENFNNSNVNGMKFISKTDESKYIFIPAAGICGDGSMYGVGEYGDVWSSSLNNTITTTAWSLAFNSDDCHMFNHYVNCVGLSIRPVID